MSNNTYRVQLTEGHKVVVRGLMDDTENTIQKVLFLKFHDWMNDIAEASKGEWKWGIPPGDLYLLRDKKIVVDIKNKEQQLPLEKKSSYNHLVYTITGDTVTISPGPTISGGYRKISKRTRSKRTRSKRTRSKRRRSIRARRQ